MAPSEIGAFNTWHCECAFFRIRSSCALIAVNHRKAMPASKDSTESILFNPGSTVGWHALHVVQGVPPNPGPTVGATTVHQSFFGGLFIGAGVIGVGDTAGAGDSPLPGRKAMSG